MSTSFNSEDLSVQPAKIQVIGVGGGGGKMLNNMIQQKISGVEFVFVSSDMNAIEQNLAKTTLSLSAESFRKLGSCGGSKAGRNTALVEHDQILELMNDTDMVFIVAGMGGRTGTCAASVIAEAARSLGILTVAVVTKPLRCEGMLRMRMAEEGIAKLRKVADSVMIIPNQKLTGNMTSHMGDGFRKADDASRDFVCGISELMTKRCYMAVGLLDIKLVLSEPCGVAMMGSGFASGDNRATEATKRAICSPLLGDINIHGAQGILFNVTGNEDMTLAEYGEAVSIIHKVAGENANIVYGMVYDQGMGNEIRVTIVVKSVDTEKIN